MSDPVIVTTNGGVTRAVLNRPDRGNALDETTVDILAQALDQAVTTGARAFLIEGAGRHFCTGFDLPESGATDAGLLHRFVRIELLLQTVYRAPIVTVAVAKGRTFGAGADLFLACDRRVTSGDASFAFPGAGFGILLGTRRLAERVGADHARHLVRTGRTIGSDEALRLNLANLELAPEGVDAMLDEVAEIVIDDVTLTGLNRVTRSDADDHALADLVRSAARPGLAERLAAYRSRVKGARRG